MILDPILVFTAIAVPTLAVFGLLFYMVHQVCETAPNGGAKNWNFPPVPSHEEIMRERELTPHALLTRIENLEKHND